MAVILEERGRGKFKPAPDYKVDEVKELLNKKIEEERQAFADCSEEIEFDKLNYEPAVTIFGMRWSGFGLRISRLKSSYGRRSYGSSICRQKGL